MKNKDFVLKVRDLLLQCLGEVPSVNKLVCSPGEPDSGTDLLAEVDAYGETWQLRVAARASGQPRYAREAIARILMESGLETSRTYTVFAAPFISQSSAEICRQAGAGTIDLAGNCRLAFGGIFMERQGRSNPFVSRRSLRSLYRARSTRVLRALLFDPNLKWKLTDLSAAAGVSIGQVFNVKNSLIDREWAVFEEGGLRLTRPEPLLRDWGKQYACGMNTAFDFHSPDSPSEIYSKLARCCSQEGLNYAVTSFFAAALMEPGPEQDRVHAYINAQADADIELAAERLQLKPAEADSNVRLMLPYDDGVFFGLKELKGVVTVSPIQTYLDLVGSGGKGAEAAENLLEHAILAGWRSYSSPKEK
jgi:hypothetical protein